jgi:hypothetical protein
MRPEGSDDAPAALIRVAGNSRGEQGRALSGRLRGSARVPALMGCDPHEFVPTDRIHLETSLPCVTSVPYSGGRHWLRPHRPCSIDARIIERV